MKSIFLLVSIFSIWTISNFYQQENKATLLGEGIISTGSNLSQAISPDGSEIYFAKMSEDRIWNIFYSKWENESWTKPEKVSFNSFYTDADPYFTADGNRLFFLSGRPAIEGGEPRVLPDIWYVEKTNDGWGEPVNLKEINTKEFGETFMSLTNDGDIIFASNRNTDKRHSIFKAKFNGSGYDAPQPFSANIKVEGFANPLIARDGSYLIFESNQYQGFGGDDLYITFRKGEEWTEPVNLGPKVNTELVEGGPFVTDDGKHLIFARLDTSVDELKSDLYQIAFQPVLEKAKERAGL